MAQAMWSAWPAASSKPVGTYNLRSEKAAQDPEKLLAYYQEILRLAKNYGKKDFELSHYFWLNLTFSRGDKNIYMNFPYYDCLEQIAPILEKIGSDENGVILNDEDDAWFAEIIAEDGFIYAREGDMDVEEIYFMQKMPRPRMATDCRETLERTRSLIKFLSENLGKDYWTSSQFLADIKL
jgi:hypothetical protein